MRTYLECLPCLIRQALEGARHATDDPRIHEEILRKVSELVADADLSRPTPEHIGALHRLIRQRTGSHDPYRNAKDRFNQSILALYPIFKELVSRSDDPMGTALQLAAGGNAIDMIVDATLEEANLDEAVRAFLSAPLPESVVSEFKTSVQHAGTILYLGDNAGEIVLDRLLIEELPREKIAYVVKGSPVINDVTMEDARSCGMTEIVEVTDNGSDLPGTVLDRCSESFRERFRKADLVISKGQGNFESLSEVDQEVFFLFKAKCEVITLYLGYEVGSPVFLHHRK